jgi:hypothetical protein
MIENDINGPFVRAAWHATTDPQAATVYGVRVDYADGHHEVWSVDNKPHEPKRLHDWVKTWSTKEKPIVNVTQVQRDVTISASDWAPSESE